MSLFRLAGNLATLLAVLNLVILSVQWGLTFTAFALACYAHDRLDRRELP